MKINFIIPFTRLSGGIRVVFQYANYLVSKGHDVVCYVPMVSYPGKGQSFLFRVKASLGNTLKKQKWFSNNFKIKLVPFINSFFLRESDITIATSWQTAYDVKNIKNTDKKFYFVQGYETFNGSVDNVENTYRLGIPMIAISNFLKQKIEKISKEKVEVIFNGLSEQEFVRPEFTKTSDEQRTILMMDHLSESKGSTEGIEVIDKVKKVMPNVHAVVFGRKISHKYPDYFEVHEDPSRNELFNLYKKSGIYLFTSTVEGWGLPILEAMAAKDIVIGRNIGALSEIGNESNCHVIKSKNEMYKATLELLKTPQRMIDIQENAYKTASNLKWDKSFSKFEKIILS